MSLILDEYQKYIDAIGDNIIPNDSGQITAPVMSTTMRTLDTTIDAIDAGIDSSVIDDIIAAADEDALLKVAGGSIISSGITEQGGNMTSRPDYLHFGFHTIHPMGENVGFTNDLSGELYTPTWQFSDVNEIRVPTYRRYTDLGLQALIHNDTNTGAILDPRVKLRALSQHRTFQYTFITDTDVQNLHLDIYGISEFDFINTPADEIDLTQQLNIWGHPLGAFVGGVARTVDLLEDVNTPPVDYFQDTPLLFVWTKVDEVGTLAMQGEVATDFPYFLEHVRLWEDLPLPTTIHDDPVDIAIMKSDIALNKTDIFDINIAQAVQDGRLDALEVVPAFSYHYDSTVINSNITPGAHQDICQLAITDILAAGTYELKISHTFSLPTLLDFFEWQVDVGGVLSDAFRREPKDLDEVFGWSYFFPVVHPGGPITITLRGAVEAGGANCTVNWANLVFEQKL